MTERVPAWEVEGIVGAKRHETLHLGRMDTYTGKVYILHPQWCLEKLGDDLRRCWYSQALDHGINPEEWKGYENQPVVLLAPALGGLFPESLEDKEKS